MAHSSVLEIISEHTDVPLILHRKNRYKFCLTDISNLPLRIKRKHWDVDQCVLTFDYKCSSFISHIGINTISEELIIVRNINVTQNWRSFSIDLSDYKDLLLQYVLTSHAVLQLIIAPVIASEAVLFQIKNIRLRSRTSDEQEKAGIKEDYKKRLSKSIIRKKNYLYDSVFPNEIDRIETDEKKIRVQGQIVSNPSLAVCLCELPIFKDLAVHNMTEITVLSPENGRFEVSVPRITKYDGTLYDRIYSRWFLAYRSNNELYLCSYGRYTTKTRTGYHFPPLTPQTKKGLGDFKYNHLYTDLKDLGISYISFNIRINNFLRLASSPDHIPFEYNGRTYYADKRKIEKYDRTIRCAAEHGVNVSAIILVYPELWSRDSQVGRMLEHPEYKRCGAYTMPNLTNIDSVNLYAAALDFLAARYNRPDGKYGRIHRWIVHNEVNSGNVWTNAGNKKLVEFMDIYVKSMRMVYYTARKYDADAEVFISLDHCWNEEYVEPNCYPGAKVMDTLMAYCKAEGDFKWGVAIHPYPENLLDPKAWLDKKNTYATDTPYITFKNLEVLDDWIKHTASTYEGKKRTLLLSEQNPNSMDYTDEALQEQAAGLAYAWKKMEVCDGIDAYFAHSWIDAHFEGGLKTGLRKYSDDPEDPFGTKPSWIVFRDAGTENEPQTFEFAKRIIGISSWEEIVHSVNKTLKRTSDE